MGISNPFHGLSTQKIVTRAFCYCCRHFALSVVRKGEVLGNRPFIDVGFNHWKNANSDFKKHENGVRHQDAMLSWHEYEKISKGNASSIATTIAHVSRAEIDVNRAQIKILLDAAIFCASQEIAFRSDRDNKNNTSGNRGNFVELVETIATHTSSEVQTALSRRYGHYCSHQYQNEILSVLGAEIRNNIAECVGQAKFFTVMADETRDVSRKEQLSIIVRYFDVDAQTIYERPIGCFHLKALDASTLSQFIIKEIKDLGLN